MSATITSISGTLIKISGNNAYIANSPTNQKSFSIYDISNPTSPSLLGSFTAANNINNIYIYGNYAYLAESGSIEIIDISNPALITSVKNYTLSSGSSSNGIFAAGKYVYATVGSDLDIFDFGVTPTASSIIPDKPGNFTVAKASNTFVNLSWSDNSNNELGFRLYRSTTAGTYSVIVATPAANSTTYQDLGLTPNTSYYYALYAYNNAGNSVNPTTLTAFTKRIPNAGIITTLAGNGTGGYSGDGGSAISAQINQPYGVAVDTSGNVYFADYYNNRIRKVNTFGKITTIAGTGTAGFSGDGGSATSAQINSPFGVAVDTSGNVYFADYMNHRIRKITASSGKISTIAGTGTAGFSGDGGDATLAKLSSPLGIGVDASRNVYIADNANARIRKITASSGQISTIAGTGTAGFSGDGGNATSANINMPYGVAVDISGNVYIADTVNNVVRKVNTSGKISTFAGTGVQGSSGDGGNATSAQLNNPYGISFDVSGNVYIADCLNHKIRKVNTSGTISTFTGSGTAGFSGDGGDATSAQINKPYAVAVDASGNIFISDSQNYRIRKANHQ
jgi:sugar lactone lactonase YvrE